MRDIVSEESLLDNELFDLLALSIADIEQVNACWQPRVQGQLAFGDLRLRVDHLAECVVDRQGEGLLAGAVNLKEEAAIGGVGE